MPHACASCENSVVTNSEPPAEAEPLAGAKVLADADLPADTATGLAATTTTRFLETVREWELDLDPAQHEAVARLVASPRHGFYLWGPVGRGKTMLAEAYFAAIPTDRKLRVHFHEFFRALHAEIIAERRPLESTLETLLGDAQAILFDEFHVHDVADAVYLTRTLEVLVESGVLVLATSNYAPTDLMPDPLFHDMFVPGIRMIERELEVVPLEQGQDYRRVTAAGGSDADGFASGVWTVAPRAAAAESEADRIGRSDTAETAAAGDAVTSLTLGGLDVRAEARDGCRARFTFAELCERPLGTHQYLDLARTLTDVEVTAVPDPATLSEHSAQRLCTLIDVLADRDLGVRFVAAAPWHRLSEVRILPIDVDRALSRLSLLRVETAAGV